MLNMSNKAIKAPNKNELMKVNKKAQAIEMVALNPGITNKEICDKLDLNKNTVSTWRNNAKFNEKAYERFMDIASGQIPEVVLALLTEAKSGNVRAAELVLKHFGKLQDTLTIKLESPYMQHLKAKEIEYDDAEITEVEAVDLGSVPDGIPLPPTDPNANKPGQIVAEKKQIYKQIKKKRKNKDQMSRYMMRKRAKAVGLDPLPAKKPTKTQRAAWIAELERLESLEK
jgi:hypothetical protein